MASRSERSIRPKLFTQQEVFQLLDDDGDDIPDGSDDERLAADDDSDDPDFELYNGEDDGNEQDQEEEDVSDDAVEDTTDGQSQPPPPKRQRNGFDGNRVFHWVKKDLPPHVNPPNILAPRGKSSEASTPIQMFSAHFDDDTITLLTLESNRFMLQLGRSRCKPVTVREMKTLLGICMYMSIVCLPNRRMYWSHGTRQPTVAQAMTVNRFEEILSVLHISDNELMKQRGEVGYDRLHKVRPLIDIVNKTFESNAEPETFVSVDEQMIPFKGRHSLKCYMMKKPKKWGYKVWAMAGRSGYVHAFQFAGDTLSPKLDDIELPVGKPGETVLELTKNQPDNSYVFFDNYFACPELLVEMKRRQLNATCTMRPNRSRKCPLLCLKDMKKKGRGAYDFRKDTGEDVLICSWFDNKIVTVASNIHSVEPTTTVRRYDGQRKQYINVQCPSMISSYNQSMGGVDKSDMLLELYRCDHKSRKWYKRIMFHLIDLCVVNSWLLYRAANENISISLCQFKLAIARALLQSESIGPEVTLIAVTHTSGFKSAKGVNEEVRYDRVGHFSKRDKEAKFPQRCKLEGCSRKSQFKCRKCDVVLCISGKGDEEDCFYLFHHKV